MEVAQSKTGNEQGQPLAVQPHDEVTQRLSSVEKHSISCSFKTIRRNDMHIIILHRNLLKDTSELRTGTQVMCNRQLDNGTLPSTRDCSTAWIRQAMWLLAWDSSPHLRVTLVQLTRYVVSYTQLFYIRSPFFQKNAVTVEPLLKDTSEVRTLDWVLMLYKNILFSPWNTDTSLISTNILVPSVYMLERFPLYVPVAKDVSRMLL